MEGDQKNCEVCNTSFVAWRNKKYCTEVCRKVRQLEMVREANERRRKGPLDLVRCLGCTVKFFPRHTKHLYCSQECRLRRELDLEVERKKLHGYVSDASIGSH